MNFHFIRLDRQNLSRNLILAGLACLPTVFFWRFQTVSNVPFCLGSPGCSFHSTIGKLTDRRYGYPLTYRETKVFVPNNRNEKLPDYPGYASASSEAEGFSWPHIVLNVIFWFGLLKLLQPLWPAGRRRRSEDPAGVPQVIPNEPGGNGA